MSATEYVKRDIAAEYLDAAMQMYLEQKYFCAIHLAAAAAELFDFHLPKQKRIFRFAVEAERGLHAAETGEVLDDKTIKQKLNQLKNSIKHMNDCEPTIEIDPPIEAVWWIEIARLSSHLLGLAKSQIAFRYDNFRSEQIRIEARTVT